ncbi:MAG: DNA polymerase III subunit alpha [Chloroflexi bacterium]|nr:DNA polymerase III subunit alpha [Chloroflexota bacterium]MDA1146791.1 DNA polymerase III subunit alpha [Chloroflexota bacterium]PKB56679.1 MAG: DNA polymerase III subunit alpha [SAR202 cluster bacterium Casp-Chloro-G1]
MPLTGPYSSNAPPAQAWDPMSFAHLHTHTEYSLLDGMSKIPDLVARAASFGMPALAVTDHGAMYGALELYDSATKAGIKPIIGLEGYVAPGSRHEKKSGEWPNHLTLLAQNETGYKNLLKISSKSHLEGFYRRPRMDRELLEEHSEGLIVLSGCPSGEFLKAIRDGDEAGAMDVAGWYRDVFPGRYYLEIMEHGIEEFSALTPQIASIAKRMELPLVLTHDSHYVEASHAQPHEVLLCIGTNATITDEKRFKLPNHEFYLKSPDEMRGLIPELPEAFANTLVIAEQVDLKLEFGRTQLPDAGVPEGMTAMEHLRELCEEGLERRYGNPTEEHRERLRYELSVIEQTGFGEYMLIVRDLARFAHEREIPMGVRGSAAASIVLYTTDVTDIEPLQYGLVFERFLNPERLSMPDVDFDFADDRREEVIRYTAERYGRDRVAQICTFGTLGPKAAVRDSGRALGFSFDETDRIARMIPDQLHITLDESLEQSRELGEVYETEVRARELIDTARSLEGVTRHASTHAAGIVISREPLMDVVPLQRATGSKDEDALPTTQYAMADVEKIGLLKVDYLGLTNLTILGRAVKLIEEQQGEALDLMALPDGDEATAELLSRAETFGVFQMESSGMRRYVAELKPANISELAAMVALFRPGPMEHIPRYIDVKHGRAAPVYPHQDLAELLDETYGVITYQDQVLQIARVFAGYTLGQADVMRKAMGKKIASVMVEERENFVAGGVAKGYDRQLAETLFDLIEPFAGYAFNKAHAFSYATIAYQTAYLKAHYPVEYMAAVLMAAGGTQDRLAAGIAECSRLGIGVLQPDVNRSLSNFSIERTADGGSAIRFGLAQIKNVGEGGIDTLIANREENGPFTTLEDFAKRVNPREVNKRVLDSLAKAGALDVLGPRGTVIGGVERLLTVAQEQQRLRETGQTSMFDLFGDEVDTPLPALEIEPMEVPTPQLLAWEKELLGTYVSEHPFQRAAGSLSEMVTAQAIDFSEEMAGQKAVVAGTVVNVRPLTTRQGKAFAALTLEDLSGQVELTIWPDSYEEVRDLLREATVLVAKVDVRSRNGRLTVAAQELAAFDLDTKQLINSNPARFRINGSRARAPEAAGAPGAPGGYAARPSGPPQGGPPPNGGSRQYLRPVQAAEEPAVYESVPSDDGPRRLRISLEETTDEAADRRRLRKICALLDRHVGELPVELLIRRRDGGAVRLGRGAVDASVTERMVSEVRALLGVLGGVEEIGRVERGAREFAAVGG